MTYLHLKLLNWLVLQMKAELGFWNFLQASLLLCFISVACWILANAAGGYMPHPHVGASKELWFERNTIALMAKRAPTALETMVFRRSNPKLDPRVPILFVATQLCAVPYWSIALASLIPVSARLTLSDYRRRRIFRRERRGLCISCGYDTRGTPDRCSECGTVLKESESQRMTGVQSDRIARRIIGFILLNMAVTYLLVFWYYSRSGIT